MWLLERNLENKCLHVMMDARNVINGFSLKGWEGSWGGDGGTGDLRKPGALGGGTAQVGCRA